MRDFIIIPYMEIDGMWTLRDSEMGLLFDRMVEERTLNKVFYDGSIAEKGQFLKLFKSSGVMPISAWTIDKQPIILIWVSSIIDGRGFIHFCGFHNSSARRMVEAAKEIVLKMSDHFKCLVGITPETLKSAIHLAELSGFKILGNIPEMIYLNFEDRRVGGIISYFERSSNG